MGFMCPKLAGMHATHGSVPDFFIAFMQSISRVPQALRRLAFRKYLSDHLVQPLLFGAEVLVLFAQLKYLFLHLHHAQ